MNKVYDIQGNEIKPGDLVVSCCGYRKIFAIRIVRKIISASVMYWGHFSSDKLNRHSKSVYNLIGLHTNSIQGIKIYPAQLNTSQLEKYNALLKTEINKNVATADNT